MLSISTMGETRSPMEKSVTEEPRWIIEQAASDVGIMSERKTGLAGVSGGNKNSGVEVGTKGSCCA